MFWQQAKLRSSWSKADTVIKRWLQERNKVLLLYNQVSGLLPSESKIPQPEIIQVFFQILIDYSSMAHFQVFEILSETAEKYSNGPSSEDSKLYSKILASTQFILDLNDKYTGHQDTPNLEQDLSQLGLVLAKRLEWENKLIQHYLKITNKYDHDGLGSKLKGFAKLKEETTKSGVTRLPKKNP